MKKIFSNLNLIIFAPLKALRKIKIDNFLGGLIIGALFSMVVNICTIKIQERITEQRILEAVEYEIFNNASQAKYIIGSTETTINKNEAPSPFFTFQKYSRDLWVYSTEPLQYIAQLPSDIQSSIVVYYSVIIPRSNELIDKTEKYTENNLSDCYPYAGFTSQTKENVCKEMYYALLKDNAASAKVVLDESYAVLNKFHPTQDRLNSFILRLLMGTESVRSLSRK